MSVFDPQGDGTEAAQNTPTPDGAGLTQPWQTVCYASANLGRKTDGVGLVTTLDTVTEQGSIVVTVGTGPWSADVYASEGAAPADLAGWGDPIASKSGAAGDSFQVTLGAKTLTLLVVFQQIGTADDCRAAFPYRGRIDSLTFTS